MGGTSLSRPWAGALGLKRLPDAKLNTAKPFAGTTVHNDAHIEAGRKEQTPRQGEIVPGFEHQFHKTEIGDQGPGGMVESAAQDEAMRWIEETIAGVILQLRKLHEQGVVFRNLLLNRREGRP